MNISINILPATLGKWAEVEVTHEELLKILIEGKLNDERILSVSLVTFEDESSEEVMTLQYDPNTKHWHLDA